MLRLRLRLAFNALVALIPRWMLTGFFKTFLTRPEVAEAAGFHVYPRTFYSPFPFAEEIDWPKLDERRHLPDINFHEPEALQLIRQLSRFAPELDAAPYKHPKTEAPFWFDNGTFTDFDAAALHAVLRQLKPKRYVELGCGFSSYISSHALARNAQEGAPCDAVFADPEPRRDMQQMLATGRIIRQRVQNLPAELFSRLAANDVLFIDTSHVLKVQGDVVRELTDILPSLASGVWIHIHDIFSPYEYPVDWVQNKIRLACNEQYGLECLLNGGDRYQVLLPLYLLWKEQREGLQKLFPRGVSRPHSFWILKR
jgi:Methyltransferase domain